jgi:hypothetical protein
MALSKDKSLGGRLRKMLATLLDQGAAQDSATDQAWLYRRGLDQAYMAIGRSQG